MKTIKKMVIIMVVSFSSQAVAETECVILLHGLSRSDSSMGNLAASLNQVGFLAVNVGYPSTQHAIGTLASETIKAALLRCPEHARVHFVTHSMGGILVRQYLNEFTIKNLGRVVMLGPPNKGSHVVDKLQNFPGFKLINGPAGLQLGTGELSVPNTLGPANFELGVIAGTRSINLILSTMLPSPDDGKVSVENTKLEGMTDHIAMPVTHPFMMKNSDVIAQVVYFLRHGTFQRD